MSQESRDFSSINLLSILCPMSFNTLKIWQMAEDKDKEKRKAFCPIGLYHLLNSLEACFTGFGADFGSKWVLS